MPVLRASQCQRILQQLALGSLGSVAVGQHVHVHVTVRQCRRLLNGLGNATQGVLSNHDTVDHDLNVVFELLVQVDRVVKRAHLAVDAHAAKALRTQVLKQLGIFALASTNHRRQHKRATALPRRQHLIGIHVAHYHQAHVGRRVERSVAVVQGLGRDLANALHRASH